MDKGILFACLQGRKRAALVIPSRPGEANSGALANTVDHKFRCYCGMHRRCLEVLSHFSTLKNIYDGMIVYSLYVDINMV